MIFLNSNELKTATNKKKTGEEFYLGSNKNSLKEQQKIDSK